MSGGEWFPSLSSWHFKQRKTIMTFSTNQIDKYVKEMKQLISTYKSHYVPCLPFRGTGDTLYVKISKKEMIFVLDHIAMNCDDVSLICWHIGTDDAGNPAFYLN